MGCMLSEIMKIYPFSDAKLVAGHTGLTRTVEAVSMLEVFDILDRLHGGEILFMGMFIYEDEKRNCLFLKESMEHGVAAIVFRIGQLIPYIPGSIIKFADDIGLPIFEASDKHLFIDYVLPIYERLFGNKLVEFRKGNELLDKLEDALVRGELPLSGISSIWNEITQGDVFILSADGAVLTAHTNYEAPLDSPVLKKYVETYCDVGVSLKDRDKGYHIVSLLKEEADALYMPVYSGRNLIGYILLDLTSGNSMNRFINDGSFVYALKVTASLVAVDILTGIGYAREKQLAREQLIDDLIMKRYSDPEMMMARFEYAGIQFNKYYCVYEISYIGKKNKKALLRTEEEDNQIDKLNKLVSLFFEAEFPGMPVKNTGSGMTGIYTGKTEEPRMLINTIKKLTEKIHKTYPEACFHMGISSVKSDICQAQSAKGEADIAMELGRKTLASGNISVINFDDVGCLRFLNKYENCEEMKEYYLGHMGKILEYEKSTKLELIKTLEAYFACGQNLRLTAERLFIHKNSLLYRIKKIESLIESDLNDAGKAFDLQLCLKLKYILDAR